MSSENGESARADAKDKRSDVQKQVIRIFAVLLRFSRRSWQEEPPPTVRRNSFCQLEPPEVIKAPACLNLQH
jgi:hypothetical protein